MIKKIQKTNLLGTVLALLLLFLASFIFSLSYAQKAEAASWGNNSSGVTVTLNPNPTFDVTVTATRQESSGVTDTPDTNYDTAKGTWTIGPIESVGNSISCTGGTTTTNTSNTRRNTFTIEVKDKASGKTVSSPAITSVNFCNDVAPAFKDITIATVGVAQATQKGTVNGTLLYVASDGSKVPFGTSTVATITCDGVKSAPFKVSDKGVLSPMDVAVISPGGSTCTFEATWQPTNSSIGTVTQFIKKQVLVKPGQTVSINETSVLSTDPSLSTTDPATVAAENSEAACDDALTPFGWVLCPIMGLADNLYTGFVTIINNLLFFSSDKFNTGKLEATSHLFVNLANIAIVLFALVMIAAQIFSFEVFSAYTVKKVLPRIVIGAILIQLSWPIFTLFIQLVNALGSGLYWMLMAPFGLPTDTGVVTMKTIVSQGIVDGGGSTTDVANALGGTASLVGIGLGVTFLTISGAWLTVVVGAIGIVISLLVAVLTLILREVILIVLLAIAPLALALWIFPGTNKYWDLWWKSFNKLLLMYPLIMLLLAGGAMAASILVSTGDELNRFFAIIAYFAPIFLIGATYKFAGDAFGAINGATGKLGNKAKGAGYFGLRDRAKLNKENSNWALSRKRRDADVVDQAQQRYGQRMNSTGAYAGFIKHRSGISEEGRARAVASSGAAVTAAEEQVFKDQAASASFVIRQLTKANGNPALTQYQNDEINRAKYMAAGAGLKDNETEKVFDIDGKKVLVSRAGMANVALQALNLKDSSEVKDPRTGATYTSVDDYVHTPGGFRALADLGTNSAAAMEVLGKRLPTAVKGNPVASLAGINYTDPKEPLGKFASGFDDALEGYAGLGKTQQKEVREALKTALVKDGRTDAVTARLATLARGGLKPDQLDQITSQFAGMDLDMAQLKNDPTGVLHYNTGTGKFEIR